ncbi:MAG TPA: transporter substrate-binding domain-containing protein [Desulfomonilia bacterium]|nr:transporter substrate-binding domain-containing protein [Desulfomonilia bacterium]
MKIIKGFLACCGVVIVLSFFMCGPAFAGKTLVVAVGGDVPTMKMKDSKGSLTGYEIDMIKAIASEAGFQVKFVEVPWKNLYNDLNAGKYDAVAASVSINGGKKERYGLSDPYFSTGQLLIVPKGKASGSVNGKNIAVFKLSPTADKVRRSGANLTYYTVEETDQAFKDLAKGNVDGVLCDTPVALGYSTGKHAGKFCLSKDGCILDPSLKKEDYGIVVKKGNTETLGLINAGLAAVKSKNMDDQIMDKWFKEAMTEVASSLDFGSMFASEIPSGPQNSPASPK